MSEDLARYIRSSFSTKGLSSEGSSKNGSESIDTTELLSQVSALDVSEGDLRRDLRKEVRTRLHGKRRKQALLPVQEEDESFENVYKLADYLPRAASEVTTLKTAQLQPQKNAFYRKNDDDSWSTVSSVDTEALLMMSDDEQDETPEKLYNLPRKGGVAGKWRPPLPATALRNNSRSSPNLASGKTTILDVIRSKARPTPKLAKPTKRSCGLGVQSYPLPPRLEITAKLQRDASEPVFHSFCVRGGGEEQRGKGEIGAFSAREWAGGKPGCSPAVRDVRVEPGRALSQGRDRGEAQKSGKSLALSYNTQQTCILPQSRLHLSSVTQISILPKSSIKSQTTDFSLLDHLQSHPQTTSLAPSLSYTGELLLGNESGRWRKSTDTQQEERAKPLQVCTCILAGELRKHRSDCRVTTIAAIVPQTEEVSYPFRPQRTVVGRKKAAISVVEATVRIQRAFRRYISKRSPPIKTFQTWSSDRDLLQCRKTSVREAGEREDPERATQALFSALDQLRVLKEMASNTSSEEASFVLSESVVSREVTPGGKGESLLPVERQGGVDCKEEGVEDMPANSPSLPQKDDLLEASIDTDLLLRSTESLDF